jgi:hypothetical protein
MMHNWSDLNAAQADLQNASDELHDAQEALETARKTANLMNAGAITSWGTTSFIGSMNALYPSEIDFTSSVITNQALTNTGQAAIFGSNALNNLNQTFDSANTNINASSNIVGNMTPGGYVPYGGNFSSNVYSGAPITPNIGSLTPGGYVPYGGNSSSNTYSGAPITPNIGSMTPGGYVPYGGNSSSNTYSSNIPITPNTGSTTSGGYAPYGGNSSSGNSYAPGTSIYPSTDKSTSGSYTPSMGNSSSKSFNSSKVLSTPSSKPTSVSATSNAIVTADNCNSFGIKVKQGRDWGKAHAHGNKDRYNQAGKIGTIVQEPPERWGQHPKKPHFFCADCNHYTYVKWDNGYAARYQIGAAYYELYFA